MGPLTFFILYAQGDSNPAVAERRVGRNESLMLCRVADASLRFFMLAPQRLRVGTLFANETRSMKKIRRTMKHLSETRLEQVAGGYTDEVTRRINDLLANNPQLAAVGADVMASMMAQPGFVAMLEVSAAQQLYDAGVLTEADRVDASVRYQEAMASVDMAAYEGAINEAAATLEQAMNAAVADAGYDDAGNSISTDAGGDMDSFADSSDADPFAGGTSDYFSEDGLT